MAEDLHEKIATISLQKFNSLPKTGKPTTNEWTVLSTIVKSQDSQNLEVVALATGSKCIGASQMTSRGDILHDSHAEVLCRRAFLRYLYNELTKDDIFQIGYDKKFILKEGIEFHFFTTHTPCGDAAIFLKISDDDDHDEELYGEVKSVDQPHDMVDCLNVKDTVYCSYKRKCADEDMKGSKKLKQELDIYRTGAKCLPAGEDKDLQLQGTRYHTLGAVRTKPGRGDPTLSLSCSDKIAKWCHVGVQGALLSLLLHQPIYLTTFTIAGGTPFDVQALQRALYHRFTPCDVMAQSKMAAKQATPTFLYAKDSSKQPCPASIIYSKVPEKSLEVAVNGRKQGVTKKNLLKRAGRLSVCKLELFRLFLRQNSIKNEESYAAVKASASDYVKKCNIFKERAGVWSSKDKQLFEFKLVE